MNWECICSYIIDNANTLMNAVQQSSQQNVCDDNGCFTNENQALGLQTSDRPVSNSNYMSNSMMLIVGLLVLYVVMSLFQSRVRSRTSQADGILNKLNLRENHDNNNDDHSGGVY